MKFLLSTFCLLLCVTGCVTRSSEFRVPSSESRTVSVIVPHPAAPYTVFVPVYEAPEAPAATPTAPIVTISFEQRDVLGQLKPIPLPGYTFYLQHSQDCQTWTRHATNVSSVSVPATLARDFWRVERTAP